MDSDLCGKITGMLIEHDDILVKFSEHDHDFISQKIKEAINVIVTEGIPEKDKENIKDRIHFTKLIMKGREYLNKNPLVEDKAFEKMENFEVLASVFADSNEEDNEKISEEELNGYINELLNESNA